ncbi:hypothetical protein [Streptomyces erythrochromogenes]|uniref:hypothetical protein n=1 Tax=Streptomyces erythrochromogenes TaxID=285574 RepID=UPI00381629B1
MPELKLLTTSTFGVVMQQISTRTLLLVVVGALTVYVALRNPALGAALGIGVVVVALLKDFLGP